MNNGSTDQSRPLYVMWWCLLSFKQQNVASFWKTISFFAARRAGQSPNRSPLLCLVRVRWIPYVVELISVSGRWTVNAGGKKLTRIFTTSWVATQSSPKDKYAWLLHFAIDWFCEWSASALILLSTRCTIFWHQSVYGGTDWPVKVHILLCIYTIILQLPHITPW